MNAFDMFGFLPVIPGPCELYRKKYLFGEALRRYMEILNNNVDVAHEATVGKISQESLFYLMSRGLNEEEASKMIVAGFIEPIVKELPLEYAVELNKLIELEMDGSLG